MNADGSEDRYTAENVTSVFREPFYEEEITNGEVDPMEFDFNFGLASPLKDESTYNYDDPQLYQNVHVSGQSLQHHEQTQIHDSGGVSGGVPGVVPGAWSDVQWKMPGAFKGKSEDGIEDRMDDCINDGIDDGMEDCMELDPELDTSTHYNSNAYNRIQPEIAGYETRDVKVSNAFQFSITSPKCETSNGVFAAPSNAVDILSGQENSRKLDQDVACSYASESLSIEYGYNPAEADIFYNGQPEFLKNETDSLFYSATGVSPPGSDVALRDSFYNSQTTWNADSGRSLRWGSMDGKDSIGNRASISAALNDMSPLTTIASFTPSATSLHSTQHSYFSAQQFMRPSIDQPPSSLARGSMDFYSLRRPSLESINSAPSDPVRCQRSLASYFHFRDRERKSCMSPGPSPGSAGWSQPRHAIRSIFKTSNNDVPMDENGSPLVDFEHDPMSPIDQQFGDGVPDIDSSATKKSKRSKRKLFTRFKPTKGQGSSHIEVKLEPAQEGVRTDSLSDVDLKDELRYPDLKAPHSKGTSNSLNNTDSGGSSNGINLQEPDYASLFTGVGKRRNLVSIKSKKKHDPSVKTDSDVKSENENDKVQTTSFSSADNSTDCISAGSMPHSSHSYTSKDSISQEQTTSSGPSAFANASKRILGARLLKKKPVNKNESSSSDIVEVDLQELDLPENTEVFSTRSLLSKTRGRKEDKAADMVDKSKIYVCGYCDRRFKRQEHLKRHFRSLHTTQKPYDCPTCSKKFSRTDNLAQHLKIHKQEEEEAARQAGTSSES